MTAEGDVYDRNCDQSCIFEAVIGSLHILYVSYHSVLVVVQSQ